MPEKPKLDLLCIKGLQCCYSSYTRRLWSSTLNSTSRVSINTFYVHFEVSHYKKVDGNLNLLISRKSFYAYGGFCFLMLVMGTPFPNKFWCSKLAWLISSLRSERRRRRSRRSCVHCWHLLRYSGKIPIHRLIPTFPLIWPRQLILFLLLLLLWDLLAVGKQLVLFPFHDLYFFYSVAAMCDVATPPSDNTLFGVA